MQGNIIIKFQKGDKESYRLIFELLYPMMCLFSKKFLASYDDAEDIVQDVFIELWHQRAKFESMNQIKAFLYLSIKNRCLNFIKHQTVKEKYCQTSLLEQELHFEEFVIEVDVIQHLNNAINKLPEQQKHVIFLGMKGLKNEEIAEKMQISINTVKHYKKIAYQQIRNQIGANPILLLLF